MFFPQFCDEMKYHSYYLCCSCSHCSCWYYSYSCSAHLHRMNKSCPPYFCSCSHSYNFCHDDSSYLFGTVLLSLKTRSLYALEELIRTIFIFQIYKPLFKYFFLAFSILIYYTIFCREVTFYNPLLIIYTPSKDRWLPIGLLLYKDRCRGQKPPDYDTYSCYALRALTIATQHPQIVFPPPLFSYWAGLKVILPPVCKHTWFQTLDPGIRI